MSDLLTRADVTGAMLCRLLRGQPTVDHHCRSGHEPRIVGRQEHNGESDVLGDAKPADRVGLHGNVATTLNIFAGGGFNWSSQHSWIWRLR
jgi:hypothetical protein